MLAIISLDLCDSMNMMKKKTRSTRVLKATFNVVQFFMPYNEKDVTYQYYYRILFQSYGEKIKGFKGRSSGHPAGPSICNVGIWVERLF